MKKTSVFWFTGLSGAGKSTVAYSVKKRLEENLYSVLVFDGDEVRRSSYRQLGFSPADIRENNILIARRCRENKGKYDVILVPIISPLKELRLMARELLAPDFYEIYFNARLPCVRRRDVKGLYAKAACGQINNLIGFSPGSVYEPPEDCDLIIDSGEEPEEKSIDALFAFIESKTGRCLKKEGPSV